MILCGSRCMNDKLSEAVFLGMYIKKERLSHDNLSSLLTLNLIP